MKKLLVCLLFCFCASLPVFALSFDTLPQYQDEGMKLYVRGTGKLQEKDYVGAISDLRRAVKIRPDMSEAFHNLGFAFERAGDIKNAAKAYKRAIQLKPNYPSALNNLGFLLATTENDVNQAVMLCRKAVELQPNSASFRDSLGWACYKAGRASEAETQFLTALRLKPNFFKSHFNLGLLNFKQRNFMKAANHFKSAIKLNPGYLKAYIPLADCYEKQNQKSKALYVYRQALSKAPESAPIRRHLQKKVKKLTKQNKKYYFRNVKKIQGSSKLQEFLSRKSKGSLMAKNYQPAPNPLESNGNFTPVSVASALEPASGFQMNNDIPAFETAQVIQPAPVRPQVKANKPANSWTDSYLKPTLLNTPQLSVKQERELERKYSLSKSYIDRGLIREAEKELNGIINVAPNGSTIGRQSRNLLLKVRKRIEQKNDQLAATHKDMGKDFFRSGQYDMAEAEFKKALRLDPENAEVHKDVALLHYNLGNYKAAYEASKRAIALDRTLKEAYVVLGSLYAKKGRSEDALRTLRRVKEVSSNHDAVDELAERMIASIGESY